MDFSQRDENVTAPIPLDGVTAALDALTATLDDVGELNDALRTVCQQVIQVVPHADMASVTLVEAEEATTAAASEDLVVDIDAVQYRAGAGPCLEAAATREIVRVDVATAHERWPEFARSAFDAGIASYLSAPLFIDDKHAGALNLYGRDPHGFPDVDGTVLEVYLAAVRAALRATARYLLARTEAEHLRAALVSRAVIDQAKGVLMAVHGIDADQAFTMLVRHSQAKNVKLNDLAVRLLASLVSPGGRSMGA